MSVLLKSGLTAPMSTHTPGPWHIYRRRPDDIYRGPAGTFFVVDADQSNVADVVINGDRSTTKSNARLIAAAPDLLAALKALLAYEDETEGGFMTGDIIKARAAIAKAEGAS